MTQNFPNVAVPFVWDRTLDEATPPICPPSCICAKHAPFAKFAMESDRDRHFCTFRQF